MPESTSKYKKEYDDLAYKFSLLGATDKQMGDFFDVTEQTINNWKKAHPSFFESIKKGKLPADANVAGALYKKACGFSYPEEHIVYASGKPTIIKVEKYYPPDTAAAFIWLKNRADWRDKGKGESEDFAAIVVAKLKKMENELLGESNE